MAVITEDMLSAAVHYLCQDPHPEGAAVHALTTAEGDLEECHARLFLTTDGTLPERKAQVESDPRYDRERQAYALAKQAMAEERARIRSCEMIIDLWRSENKQANIAERVR